MSELVPTQGQSLASPSSGGRSVERFATRVDNNARKQLAIIEAEADLQIARVQAIGYVGHQTMQMVAMVSQMEGQLAELVPLATTRLQAIADMTALSAAEVLAGTLRKISK